MLRAAACQRKSGRRFDFFPVFRLARSGEPSLLGAGGNLPGKSVRTNPVLLVFPRSPRLIGALVRTRRTLSNEQTLVRYIMGATMSRCEEAEEPEVRALDSLTTGSPPPFFARSCWVGSQEEYPRWIASPAADLRPHPLQRRSRSRPRSRSRSPLSRSRRPPPISRYAHERRRLSLSAHD